MSSILITRKKLNIENYIYCVVFYETFVSYLMENRVEQFGSLSGS